MTSSDPLALDGGEALPPPPPVVVTPYHRVNPALQNLTHVPPVTIGLEAYLDLWAYVEAWPLEISGIGEVVTDPLGGLHISRVCILQQRSTMASTDLTEALAALEVDAARTGEDLSRLKLWWHSHGPHATFWSSEDQETIDDWGGDFLLSLLVNRHRDLRLRLDVYSPVRFTADNLALHLRAPAADLARQQRIGAEIRAKVAHAGLVLGARRAATAVKELVRGGQRAQAEGGSDGRA